MVFDKVAHKQRMQWFTEARYGMFIHWGLYAIPARGEWYRGSQRVPTEQYMKYFEEFNPTGYDPKAWAKAAKDAGMKYAVLTAKHHDGFCLFDSKLTDFKATNTPAGRDLIKEYVEAFRAEGLGVGIYYSIIDWNHPHYPHYNDPIHPRRLDPEYENHQYDFNVYLDYMHGQVREICTNYGKIDILWFDYSYDNLKGEAWRATELIKMVRELQPNVIIDNRLEGTAESSLKTKTPHYFSGDFISPEQLLPPRGMFDEDGNRIPWEACITLNDNWGYAAGNHTGGNYKPPSTVIKKLVECVSKDGNLLLNVGPDAKGRIPWESLEIIADVGRWLSYNGESIYNCTLSELPKPEWGRLTQNGKKLYLHVMEPMIGFIPLEGVSRDQIEKIRLLSDGREMRIVSDWKTVHYNDITFIDTGNSHKLPCDVNTVIEVTLK
ncbi:MAG: alpha-L-fucosidase [Defluviitaleaceae bacterium]|nr:alpha-L-fucosidase [Defluviitaleaceae bacterium]